MKQRTVKQPVMFEGKGLHKGQNSKLIFKPSPPNNGVRFIMMDLPDKPVIEANVENVIDVKRGTILGYNGIKIYTVEHIFSALSGLGIYNLDIEMYGNEPPALDGSSKPFAEGILKAGIKELDTEQKEIKISKYLEVIKGDKKISVIPHNNYRISFTIDYDHPFINRQSIDIEITPEIFKKEIMGARTFGFMSDYETLKKAGQALGANLENTIALEKDNILNSDLRFKDEFVRHKVLDVMGDFFLLGGPLKGHIIGYKTGHLHNIELIKKIHTELKNQKYEINWDILKIKKILPHRYPFLLVDKIVLIEPGKRAVGIKNVSINEYFFNGHFPQQPIMPGVLIIEALAQVAGVFMLSQHEHQGKLPYFTGIDKVRFRKPVFPGDQLELTVEIIKIKNNIGKVNGIASVNNRIVASGELMFSLVRAPEQTTG